MITGRAICAESGTVLSFCVTVGDTNRSGWQFFGSERESSYQTALATRNAGSRVTDGDAAAED